MMTERYDRDDADRAFDRDIAPRLHALEKARTEAITTSRKRMGPAFLGLLAVGGASYWVTQQLGWSATVAIVALIAAAILAWMWVQGPKSGFVQEQRTTFMTAVAEHVGDMTYTYDCSFNDFAITPFREAKIVPSHSSTSLHDLIDGTYRECRYALVEAKLETQGNNQKTTVFDGLLIRISMPRRASDRIVISKDYSKWGSMVNNVAGWFVPGDRVSIPHPEFEQKFEVYAKNPIDVQNFITRDFVENFLKLPRVLETEEILAAFIDDQFLLSANKTKPFLEGFSASTPVDEMRDLFKRAVEEARLAHRVIDQLLEGDRYAAR